MKKFIPLAIVTMLAASSANADSIYIDVGNDYDSGDNASSVNANSTGWFDSLAFTYNSETIFTDANNDQFLGAGDTFTADAGMALGATFGNLANSIGTNLNGAFFPGENGFGTNPNSDQWAITFGISNLTGQVNANGTLSYNTGTISMYFYEFAGILAPEADISADLVSLFDMNIDFGFTDGDSTNFMGDIGNFGAGNVNGVAAGSVFNIAYGATATTFANAAGLPGGLFFDISNDTQGDLPAGYDVAGGTAMVEGQHEGSVAYAVPEPTSLAILGLGLLGFAGTRRRKS
jgi:hypothetical protein